MKSLTEKQSIITVNFFEYMSWNDTRLKYDTNLNVPKTLREYRIDLTRDRNSIWMP